MLEYKVLIRFPFFTEYFYLSILSSQAYIKFRLCSFWFYLLRGFLPFCGYFFRLLLDMHYILYMKSLHYLKYAYLMVLRPKNNGYFASYKMNYPENTENYEIKQAGQQFSFTRCFIYRVIFRSTSKVLLFFSSFSKKYINLDVIWHYLSQFYFSTVLLLLSKVLEICLFWV